VISSAGNLGDAGGVMLAIFAYPILLAMLEHGPAGLTLWLNAKFFNKVPGTAATTPGAPTTPWATPLGPGTLAPVTAAALTPPSPAPVASSPPAVTSLGIAT
jgi:hypothetical protein